MKTKQFIREPYDIIGPHKIKNIIRTGNNKIINIPTPEINEHPVHKSYSIQKIERQLSRLISGLKEVAKDGESPEETLDRLVRISNAVLHKNL